MIKGIIFDLDGTLADSLEDIATSLNAVLAREGLPTRDREEVRIMIGSGMSMLVRRAIGASSGKDDEIARLRSLVEKEYDIRCLETTRPYPGVRELIESLRSRQFRLAVLSNKTDSFVASMSRALFPPESFDPVRGQRQGEPMKPDPAAALSIARQWNLPPREMALVGDSAVDMETARNAGMAGLGAAWGFRGRAELEAAGALAVFDHPSEIGRWLEEHCGTTLHGAAAAQGMAPRLA